MSLPATTAHPEPALPGDGETSRHPWRTSALPARGAATGLLLGAGLGVLARLWMRAVSTDPEFSWAGTAMILGLFAGAGLLVGTVRALRLAGRSAWWKLLLLPAVLLFGGPGMLLLPGSLVGGWGFAGRGPRWLRAACLVLALAVLPLVLWFVLVTPYERVVLDPVVVVVGFALLQGLLALGTAELFRRHTGAGRQQAAPEASPESGLEPAAVPATGVVERRG